MAVNRNLTNLRTLIREVIATMVDNPEGIIDSDSIETPGETVQPPAVEILRQGLEKFSSETFNAAKALMVLRDSKYFRPGTTDSDNINKAGKKLRRLGILPLQGIDNGNMEYFITSLNESDKLLSEIIDVIDNLSADHDSPEQDDIYKISDALHHVENILSYIRSLAMNSLGS